MRSGVVEFGVRDRRIQRLALRGRAAHFERDEQCDRRIIGGLQPRQAIKIDEALHGARRTAGERRKRR